MELKIEQLSFQFGKKTLFKNASYTFTKGKIYGLLGNNGVGKTTLFNIIAGIINTNAFITLDNKQIDINNISYIRSIPNIPEFLTGEEYIKYFLKLERKVITEKTIDEYFEKLYLSKEDKHKLLKDYSHGMKQKIELLINIILDTDIILLDEPLTNLDIVTREEFKTILNSIKKDKIIIMSTHMLELCHSLCDEVVVLSRCKLKEIDNEQGEIIHVLKEEK